jgi:polyhydroxybutyrate depolymerase
MNLLKAILYYVLLPILLIAIAGILFLFRWDIFHPLKSDKLNVDGIAREFYYYVPAGIVRHPKLVFVLHGSKIGPRIMRFVTGHEFDRLSDEKKDVIIVYPQGYKNYWNDCRKAGTYETKKKGLHDVLFFERMISFFSDRYQIDTTRIFAAGVSGGGQMCFRLANEKPALFKGFAVVSANLPADANDDCHHSGQAGSLLIMNGTADPINPYRGGEMISEDGQKRGLVMSTDQTISYWNNLMNYDSALTEEYGFPDLNKDDKSTVVRFDYRSHSNNKEVVLIKIINGGHVLPNPVFSWWPLKLGTVNKDINAPEIIFNYFMSLK